MIHFVMLSVEEISKSLANTKRKTKHKPPKKETKKEKNYPKKKIIKGLTHQYSFFFGFFGMTNRLDPLGSLDLR